MRPILSITVGSLLAVNLVAADYHVRVDGDDKRCRGLADAAAAGAPACAFATPQRCADAVGPGDACLIHAGVYRACPTSRVGSWPVADPRKREAILTVHGKRGTAESPIVIRGAGDGEVVLEATGGCDYGILHVGSSHVTYGGEGPHQGFVFRGGFDHNRGADDRNRHVYDGGTILMFGGEGNRLLGHRLEGTTLTNWPPDEGPGKNELGEIIVHESAHRAVEIAFNQVVLRDAKYGIALPNSASCAGRSCPATEPHIHHNSVVEARHGIRHIGIYVKGAGNARIDHNFVQLGLPDRPSANSQVLYIRDTYGASIFDNYLEHWGEGHGLYVQDTGSDNREGHRIVNNHFVGGGRMGCWCMECDDCEVRNNLIAGLGRGRWRIGIDCTEETSGGSWGHNAFYRIEKRNYWGEDNPRCSSSGCGAGCEADDTNLYEVAPGLVGRGEEPVPRLRLAAGSPLIDAGASLDGGPTDDFDGEPRARPDIGADEYVPSK